MELAFAPYAKGIYVYQTGTESTFTGALVDGINAAADDGKVSAFSISYDQDEGSLDAHRASG